MKEEMTVKQGDRGALWRQSRANGYVKMTLREPYTQLLILATRPTSQRSGKPALCRGGARVDVDLEHRTAEGVPVGFPVKGSPNMFLSKSFTYLLLTPDETKWLGVILGGANGHYPGMRRLRGDSAYFLLDIVPTPDNATGELVYHGIKVDDPVLTRRLASYVARQMGFRS
jgi:hypothetical protein